MSVLDLPDYNWASLSWVETRTVYINGELRFEDRERELLKEDAGLEQIARELSGLRNALRCWTRTLMSDRREAARLDLHDPNLTWDEVVAINQADGSEGDDLYRKIIAAAKRSRPGVNKANKIDPKKPPPLPPVLPSSPSYTGRPCPLGKACPLRTAPA